MQAYNVDDGGGVFSVLQSVTISNAPPSGINATHWLLHLCSASTLSRITSFDDGLTLNYRSSVFFSKEF